MRRPAAPTRRSLFDHALSLSLSLSLSLTHTLYFALSFSLPLPQEASRSFSSPGQLSFSGIFEVRAGPRAAQREK